MEANEGEEDDTVRFVDDRITSIPTKCVADARAFQRVQRTRSYSCCENPNRYDRPQPDQGEELFDRRPRSNSEPLKVPRTKSQARRSQVRFLTPFSHKDLEGLSDVIAGGKNKMKAIDLDFIGLPVNARRTERLEDLEEVSEDTEEVRDLRLSHFERALAEGRLKLKSDRIWRYKKHRKGFNSQPVEEWLYNNNSDMISAPFKSAY